MRKLTVALLSLVVLLSGVAIVHNADTKDCYGSPKSPICLDFLPPLDDKAQFNALFGNVWSSLPYAIFAMLWNAFVLVNNAFVPFYGPLVGVPLRLVERRR